MHVWPVVAKANSMEGVVEVKVATNRVGVKSDEDDISEFRWVDLQFDVISNEIDVFVDV